MPANDPIPNQDNFQDPQNFKIDIEKIYQDFIQQIDDCRSIVNVFNQGNQSFLNKFDRKTITSLPKFVKIETTPQESRCHTFFRLIGFPVVSNDMTYYSPGFDICNMQDNGLTRQMGLDEKITIANNPIDKFTSISQQRENYINRFLDIFSQNGTIDASTLALSSSTHTREFIVPLQDVDPFDMLAISQTYTANFSSQIGQLTQVSLLDFVDDAGNKTVPGNLQTNRYHFIKPFIVDPRIDFTVPNGKKVAVPFCFNKSNLLIADNTYVKRPLIEKVIRDRLLLDDQANTLGDADQFIRDYIQNIPSVKDQDLIQQMISGKIYKLGEQQQFNKYLRIIGAMILKLVEAQNTIQAVQSKYYWLPKPSTSGPEGGSAVKNVVISVALPTDFLTTSDRSLILAILKQNANQFNAQTATTDGTPNAGDFVFGAFTTTFDDDTSKSLGNIAEQTVQELTDERNQALTEANSALRTVEIVMGEFSGFGLCDIIAIMGSLYIIPIENLLGLLDADAYDRMTKVLGLKDPPDQSDLNTSMKSLAQSVKNYYNIMDKIYVDVKTGNNLA